MNRQLDQFDIEAERESNAISRSYKPKTIDFGKRQGNNHYTDVVKTRKISRHRAKKQTDLRLQKVHQFMFDTFAKPIVIPD